MSVTYTINKTTLTFGNLYYVDTVNGNDSNIGTESSPFLSMTHAISMTVNGDGIYLKGVSSGDLDFTGKNITVIGNFLKYGSKINGRCHGSSSSYATVTFIGLYIYGPGGNGWTEQFYYINSTVYNCIYQDTSTYSNVYGTYHFYNCFIILMASPYSTTYYVNCAFKSAFSGGTQTTCIQGMTYDSNYKLTSGNWKDVGTGTDVDGSTADLGIYGGTYSFWVNVTGISLNSLNISLGVNDTYQLVATVTPDGVSDKTVLWTSSDETVATVDSTGLVTCIGCGGCTITATTEDQGFIATCDVVVQVISDFINTAIIRQQDVSDVASTFINQLSDLIDALSTADLYLVSGLNSTGKIKLIDLDLVSKYFRPYHNELSSKALFTISNEMDVDYSVPYGENTHDFDSILQVPLRSSRYSTARIKPIDLDFYSKYVIPWFNSIQSIIRITQHDEMDVLYKLIQAPINQELIPVLKDSYTKQSRPTLNYGGSATLISGVSADGEYITYLEFDLSDVIAQLKTNKMMLRGLDLMLTFPQYQTGTLSIYQCNTDWSEYSINWETPVDISTKILDYTVSNKNTVAIDFRSIIVDLINAGKTKFNIAIRSSDFFLIRSKESDFDPELRFRYSDPNWQAFAEEYSAMSTALIRRVDNRDFQSVIQILTKFYENSVAIIKKIDKDFEGTTIINSDIGYKNLKSTAKIQILLNDLISKVTVNSKVINSDLSSTYYQPSIPQLGKVDIKLPADFSSTASIMSEVQNDNNQGTAFILLGYMKSLVNIIGELILQSTALIQAFSQSNVTSTVTLEKIKNNLSSTVMIGVNANALLNGNAFILGGGLASTYRLRQFNKFSSTAFIRGFFNDSIQSTEITQRSNKIDKNSHVSILSGIQNSDINSTIGMKVLSQLISNGVIERINLKDLTSTAIVKESTTSVISGTANLKLILDGLSTVIVQRYNELNFSGKGIIQRSDILDHASTGSIYQVASLDSIAEVMLYTVINSLGIIQQLDITEQSSHIYITDFGADQGGFPGIAVVQRRGFSSLNGVGTINTTARKWVPNVQGNDIFKFNNHKLPRIWIRENFIS